MNTFNYIRNWAMDRNLIQGSTDARQLKKLLEEVGELCCAVAEKDKAEIEDGIGDVCVVLSIIAAQNGLLIEECIMSAYHEIKDRKGRMENGIFIKEK